MNRAEALAELRYVIDDTVAPYAWSDARLIRFLALGQTQFCKDTGFIRDSTNYSITTSPGVASYPLAPEIVEVLGVQLAGLDLTASSYGGWLGDGTPFAYHLGKDTGSIVLLPAPDAVYTLNLQVWRSARTALEAVNGQFEIHPDFHLALIEWAAAKCFGDHDRERQDPVKAADHLANYRAIVKDGKTAFRRLHGEQVEVVPNRAYIV